ncbi:biotin synthase BioB [Selenihalanaerobacter shriftii]|uniref:Biotin synthase n=1 Tax=Selenihalanaerobacter shriftii TaxID=142842 RepID=A0A1T4JQU5_9FIRM|nr:biotin synthase BioB [Selenihalanaerobacter shriftii]SJZ32524.1 biotin synthase [Selenihalanaerobacter shriftii]
MERIEEIFDKVMVGEDITVEEAKELSKVNDNQILDLIVMSKKITDKFTDGEIDFCSIVNAKSGSCSEDCKFCAQSAHYDVEVTDYSMLLEDEIIEKAKKKEEQGADHFGIVTSGKGVISDGEVQKLIKVIKRLNQETDLKVCLSLGTLSKKAAEELAGSGLNRYHHNLETSRSYFSEICTTHNYQERVETVANVKEVGLEICCGGIIGLGESFADRIEMAFELKRLDVDSVPINILNPVEGTPLEDNERLEPLEILKTIAIFRFILPDKLIRYGGGREDNLRDLQSLGVLAGVNGLLIGNYLTTKGREATEDIQMIKDLGLI